MLMNSTKNELKTKVLPPTPSSKKGKEGGKKVTGEYFQYSPRYFLVFYLIGMFKHF